MNHPDAARPPAPALWRDLVLRLALPLMVIVAATGLLGLLTAQKLTERTFDHWLLDAARALALQVRFVDGQALVELGGDAEAILSYDAVDTTYFAVRQGGRHIAGHRGLPDVGREPTRYPDGQVFDAQFARRPIRVAVVPVRAVGRQGQAQGPASEQAQVLVAETLAKREGVRRDLQLMLLPFALLLLLAAAATLLALRRTLKPLEQIAARWNARSHASLQAIDPAGVPRELMPFASALNDLLARIHAMLQRERRLAANAAHQIRTPLAALQLGLARAAEAPDLASSRAVVQELQHRTQRTARLLQQLLALGRLDPETAFDLGDSRCELGAMAHDVGALYLEAALARGVTLELLAPDTPVSVPGQPELLAEALGNLVDNALRYGRAGGRVEIALQASPPTLLVRDDGPGVAPALRDTVLERYVRGPEAGGDGSGLGLAIVHEIAQLHRAQLHLEDSPLGGLQVRLVFDAGAA